MLEDAVKELKHEVQVEEFTPEISIPVNVHSDTYIPMKQENFHVQATVPDQDDAELSADRGDARPIRNHPGAA
jgi:hypothetical protein